MQKILKDIPKIVAIRFQDDRQPERIPLSDDITPDSTMLSVLSSIEYISEDGTRLMDITNYLVWVRDQNGETIEGIEESKLATKTIGEYLYLIKPEEFEPNKRFSNPHYCLDLVIKR